MRPGRVTKTARGVVPAWITDPTEAATRAAAIGARFGRVVLAPLGGGADDDARIATVEAACINKFSVIQTPGTWYTGVTAYTVPDAPLYRRQPGTLIAPTDACLWSLQPTNTTVGPFGAWISSHSWYGLMDSMFHLGYNAHGEVLSEPTLRWGIESDYQTEPGRRLLEAYIEWDAAGNGPASPQNGWRTRPFYVFVDRLTGWSRTYLQTGYGPSYYQVSDPGGNGLLVLQAAGVKVIGGAGAPGTIVAGDDLVLNIDGTGPISTIFVDGDTTFDKIAQRINVAFGPKYLATVEGGVLTLISHATPPAGSVEVVGGSAVAKCGLVVGLTTSTPGYGWHIYKPSVQGNWGYPAITPPAQSNAALDALAARCSAIETQVSVLQADQLSTALAARFRADMGVTIVGGVVSQWDDTRLGSTVSASQATAGKRPTRFLNGGPNNRAYIHFVAASNMSLVTGAIVLAQPCYVIVVGRFTNAASASGTMVDAIIGNRMRIFCAAGGEIDIYAGAHLSYGAGSMTSWRAYGAYFNGGASTISINSTLKATGDAGAAAEGGITIGDFGGGGDPLNGDIAEVIVIPSPTAQVLSRINQYLNAYYNLTP